MIYDDASVYCYYSFYMKNIIWLCLLTCACAKAQTPVTPDSAYLIQDSVDIPTRTGIPISAIIVRKKNNSRALPVILFYTTYDQGSGDAIFGKRAADRDYVGIVAYARGIRKDLKQYFPYEHEGTDVYDIIDWISKQSWCNGKVGMYGGSYTGYSQWATVKKIHPALKTIVPQVAVMPGYDAPMENGVPYGNILGWANDNIYKNKPYRRSLVFEWFEKGTAFRSMDTLGGQPNPIFQKWLNHPGYDQYWQSMVPSPQEYAAINIPILSTTGYYDGSQIGALQYFRLHTTYNKNAEHYFVIGPYDHISGQRSTNDVLMDYKIDPVANISMRSLAFDWLDYILKGKSKPELLKDKVNYEVMGANEWKHVSSLDKMNNDTMIFYLGEHNLLSSIKTTKPSYIKQTVDFTNREVQNSYYTPSIVFDSLDTGNGIQFTSAPVTHEFDINGSYGGDFFITINKKDVDLSAALYQAMPDGKYFFLTRYVGRASYAKDSTKRNLLVPGKMQRISFHNTRFVSRRISKGSRLVLVVNVNKHPFEIVNYGSGKEVCDETIQDAGQPLQIQWHNNSYIRVPVLK